MHYIYHIFVLCAHWADVALVGGKKNKNIGRRSCVLDETHSQVMKPIWHSGQTIQPRHVMHTGPKGLTPKLTLYNGAAVNCGMHFLNITTLIKWPQFNPFSLITFGKSKRATRLNYLIPIQVSGGLIWKIKSSASGSLWFTWFMGLNSRSYMKEPSHFTLGSKTLLWELS